MREGKGLSIIIVEGVDRLAIAQPSGTFNSDDVRATIGAVARAKAIAVRASDLSDKDLGEVAIQWTEIGWELRPPMSTVRLNLTAK
jgi:hypothetical protein